MLRQEFMFICLEMQQGHNMKVEDNQIEEILDRIDQIEFQQRLMIEKLTQLVEKFGKHINNVERLMKNDPVKYGTPLAKTKKQ